MKETLYLLFLFIVVFLTAGTIAAILMGIGQRIYQNYQRRYLQSMTSSLENMFIFLSPSRILNLSFVVAILIFFITLLSTGFNLVISLAMGLVGILGPRIGLNTRATLSKSMTMSWSALFALIPNNGSSV